MASRGLSKVLDVCSLHEPLDKCTDDGIDGNAVGRKPGDWLLEQRKVESSLRRFYILCSLVDSIITAQPSRLFNDGASLDEGGAKITCLKRAICLSHRKRTSGGTLL